jgi:phage anti-repressor protein
MNNFSLAIAQDLFDNTNPFPVDFDVAWEWLDFSNKANAKKAFKLAGFIEDTDFILKDEPTTTGIQAHPREIISLSVDCLKMWAMMAGTQKGKEVRRYFLECEKIAKFKTAVLAAPIAPVAPIETKMMAANVIDKLSNNDRLPAAVKQLLIDSLVNEYIDATPKLPANTQKWVGVVQKAEELGFKTDSSSRVKLGHFVSSQAQQVTRQKEERLCNGEMRKIWVYLDDHNLAKVIQMFFNLAAE